MQIKYMQNNYNKVIYVYNNYHKKEKVFNVVVNDDRLLENKMN